MEISQQAVQIIGAGPVGSLWALFLARKGYSVELYERRGDMRLQNEDRGRSINLALSDRGLKALHAVGLETQVKAMAIPMHGRMVHGEDGSTNFQPYGLDGQFINSISRVELNKLLMTEAEKQGRVKINFNHRCLDVNMKNNNISFEDVVTGVHNKIEVTRVFGADGAYSALCTALVNSAGLNHKKEYLEHGYKELTVPAGPFDGFQLEKNALHIWPRKSFMLIALPNLDGSFTCTLFLALKGDISFDRLQEPEDVILFFEKYFPDALELMPDFPAEFFQNPTSSLVTVRTYPWSYQNNFLLLGDAAHAVVPFYGQGMNAGFEDCTVLNDLLNEFNDDWDKVIPTFQKRRKPDTDAIAELAVRNFKEMRDSVIDEKFLLRRKIEKAMQLRHPDKFLPLYSMVTFSDMPYSKALSTVNRHDAFFAKLDKAELVKAADNLDTDEGNTILDRWVTELKLNKE